MTRGYGLAEKVRATSVAEDWFEVPNDTAELIEELIRAADNHTGILGGQGHLGCPLCAAVKELRRWYGLE